MQGTVRITIVDDDEDDRLLLANSLHDYNPHCQLQFAEDGYTLAAQLAVDAPPALILLDLNLPQQDGFEILEQLRQDTRTRTIPIIMMTVSTAKSDIERAYRLGANSFISKPDTYQQLRSIIESLCHYWLHIAKLPGQ
jgi:CheY-like chemotaxis protein